MKYFLVKPLFLVKDLLKLNHVKINQIENGGIYWKNELRNAVIRKEISENENPNEIISIVEKILNFNNQQKGKGLKKLSPKQMLQMLPIVIAPVNAGNTSENLLDEICWIIYSLYQA